MKSLALASKAKSLVLALKPASSQKYPVLGSRTALCFDLLKMGQGYGHLFYLSWGTPGTSLKLFETFFFHKKDVKLVGYFILLKKFANSLRKDLFYLFFLSFFGEHLNFAENLRFFERRTVVACFTNTCALSPWPRAFPYLALIESVLGWSVLDLGFFCVLGLEPCVLESTFV